VFRPGYLPWIFGLYATVLFGSAAVAALRRHKASFLATLPVVLVIEHLGYVAGFWYGILHSRLAPRRSASRAREESP
jgi:hypothetical protein